VDSLDFSVSFSQYLSTDFRGGIQAAPAIPWQFTWGRSTVRAKAPGRLAPSTLYHISIAPTITGIDSAVLSDTTDCYLKTEPFKIVSVQTLISGGKRSLILYTNSVLDTLYTTALTIEPVECGPAVVGFTPDSSGLVITTECAGKTVTITPDNGFADRYGNRITQAGPFVLE
jgi:hypothetical protein